MAPCSRCGTFLCGDCTEVMGEAAWCSDCVAWLRRNGPPSRRVKALIVLGLVGMVSFPLCMFLAPVVNLVVAVAGLWVPARELRRIQRGEGPLRGRRQAQAALVLGGVNLVLFLLWAGLFVYAFFTRSPAR